MENKTQSIKLLACLLFAIIITSFTKLTYAGSTNVAYPNLKNNGTTWYKPSIGLKSYYDNYFTDMDRSYKQQVVSDK